MDSFYVKVDSHFLNLVDSQVRTKLEKEIQYTPDHMTYVRMCPYCNHFYIIHVGKENVIDKGNPKFCVYCGEPSPFDKIEYSMKKVRTLFKLSSSCMSANGDLEDVEIERILLEQCIVNFATGIELFLKDIFVIGMDLKFVKSEHSLFSKFYKDTKNEFLNIGKLNKRFKDELKLDLKSLFSEDILKGLNIIMLKRNAIVHNNGLADKTFIEQSGIECRYGARIPICSEEIEKYLVMAESIIEILKQEFDRLFFPELKKKIDIKLQDDRYYLFH